MPTVIDNATGQPVEELEEVVITGKRLPVVPQLPSINYMLYAAIAAGLAYLISELTDNTFKTKRRRRR